MSWERVITIEDFYDVPRQGIAFCNDKLVAFRCCWDARRNDYSDAYDTTEIDISLLPLAEEYSEIWRRWEAAYKEKLVSIETSPCLPEDRDRHAILQQILEPVYDFKNRPCTKRRAEFRLLGGELVVLWSAAILN